MKTPAKLLFVIVAVVVAGCEAPIIETGNGTPVREAGDQDVRGEIELLNEQWLTYANDGDFTALVSLYAQDAIVITPEGRLEGRDAIEADFRADFVEGQQNTVHTDRIEVAESGDLAYIVGTWASDLGYRGSYLSVVERRGAGWLWVADAWNVTERPEP